MVFAVYAGADGLLSTIAGLRGATRKEERWSALILRGVIGIAVAAVFVLSHDGLEPTDKDSAETGRGPAADARSNDNGPDPRTGGGQPQEDVEDRPGVSTVTREDYPEDERAKG